MLISVSSFGMRVSLAVASHQFLSLNAQQIRYTRLDLDLYAHIGQREKNILRDKGDQIDKVSGERRTKNETGGG
jgi:hypothetical protein